MKSIKLSTFSIFFVVVLIGSGIFYVPVYIIQELWNTFVATTYTEYEITFWQAVILWYSILTFIYLTGIFKFELAVESVDASERDKFKNQIETLKKKAQEAAKSEKDKTTKES